MTDQNNIKILSYEISGVDLYQNLYNAQHSEAIFLFTFDNNISGYRPMTAQEFINNIDSNLSVSSSSSSSNSSFSSVSSSSSSSISSSSSVSSSSVSSSSSRSSSSSTNNLLFTVDGSHVLQTTGEYVFSDYNEKSADYLNLNGKYLIKYGEFTVPTSLTTSVQYTGWHFISEDEYFEFGATFPARKTEYKYVPYWTSIDSEYPFTVDQSEWGGFPQNPDLISTPFYPPSFNTINVFPSSSFSSQSSSSVSD